MVTASAKRSRTGRTAAKKAPPAKTNAAEKTVAAKRPSAPRAASRNAAPKAAGADAARLTIRMYRHGLGDCLLLRFAKPKGGTFNLLIDCGLVMVAQESKKKMKEVAADIAQTCDNHIDAVVMTHEHWDHASGFSVDQAQEVFDELMIGEVWYGWTEDPQNALGKKLRKERADKVRALASAASAFTGSKSPSLQERGQRLNWMLSFFGIADAAKLGAAQAIGRTRGAFEYLMHRPDVKTKYLYPDKAPLTLPGVPNLRVYVLGPPEDESYIKKSAPSKSGSEVYEFAADVVFSSSLASAFSRHANPAGADVSYVDCPFDASLRQSTTGSKKKLSPQLHTLISSVWNAPSEAWRKVEEDWTQAAETLALNLDAHTNNTCVVLAFEFTDTGEVFLFPADAQVGNWLSWQTLSWDVKSLGGTTKVTASDLLARTVFYKVGHHGSHNATLRKLGLEQMTNDELIAFIPVVEAEAQKNRWMNMPFKPLVKRLKEKTAGRVLRSDQDVPDKTALSGSMESQKRFLLRAKQDKLYFEYVFA
jgi:hypothetical protein